MATEKEQFLKIPYKILLNKKLNNAQKILFGVLNGFLEKNEYVIYPNNKLSALLGCSENSVDRDLKALEKEEIIGRVGSSYRRKIYRGALFFNTNPKNEGCVEDLNTYPKNGEVLPQKWGSTTPKMWENIDIKIDNLHNKNQNPKEIKNKEKSFLASPSTSENVVKLQAVKKLENEVAVDPNYSYPETYFGESKELSLVSSKTKFKTRDQCPQIKKLEAIAINQGCSCVTVQELNYAKEFWDLYPVKHSFEPWAAHWFSKHGCYIFGDQVVEKLKQQLKEDQRFSNGYAPNPKQYVIDKRYNDEIFEGKKSHFDYQDTSWMDSKYDDIFDKLG